MGTPHPVGRLARGHLQGLPDQVNFQVQEERAVEYEEASLAPLGVAAELESANGEIALAPPFDGRQ